MKNKLFKLILLIIIFVLVISAVYYFIDKTNFIEKEKTVKLYFSTSDAMYLAAEERVIKGRNLYKAALNALIEGPTDSSLSKTIPEGVKVLNISKNNDTIQVDFSEEIAKNHWGGSSGERLTVYSVVYTLTQFKGVKQVKFLIEGEEVETLVGHMDLTVPLEPNPNILR